MKAGSMEALIGANQSMKLANTPMRVYKEAERRGDTETMERAMGYVQEFEQKADDYSQKAQEETVKEIKEERKEQEIKREQATLKRKAEQNEREKKLQEDKKSDSAVKDSVEISEEGRIVLKNSSQTEESTPIMESTDVKMYTDEGKPLSVEQTSISVDTNSGAGVAGFDVKA